MKYEYQEDLLSFVEDLHYKYKRKYGVKPHYINLGIKEAALLPETAKFVNLRFFGSLIINLKIIRHKKESFLSVSDNCNMVSMEELND